MERIIAHHQFNLVIEVPVCDTFITPGQESQISYMAHSQLLTPPPAPNPTVSVTFEVILVS